MQCGDPCLETYFDNTIIDGITIPLFHDSSVRRFTSDYMIVYDEDYYVSIIYRPKIKRIDLMIDMVNTMSLWRGTSFAFILSAMIWLIKHIANIVAKVNFLNTSTFIYRQYMNMIKSLFKVRQIKFQNNNDDDEIR